MKFSELGLSREILQGLKENGFEETFPIQEKAIPIVLSGKDLIGKAQSGSGKTLAFSIPILEKINKNLRQIQSIVLAPTRELALQIYEEMLKAGKHRGLRYAIVYGGKSMEMQIRALREGAQIVIATPGRFIDHLQRGNLNLNNVRIVVLDEADRMLDMGFIDDVNFILRHVPRERQTLLFSATLPEPIRAIVHRYMKTPHTVELNKERPSVETVKQKAYIAEQRDKLDCLFHTISQEKPERAIIFCSTKAMARKLAFEISTEYKAAAIHGDLTQGQRERVMDNFREGRTHILIATDVAARGIDVTGISHVINFDMPNDVETYIHRIGRTGRAGASGTAITIVTPMEALTLLGFEHMIKAKVEKKQYIEGRLVEASPEEFGKHRAIIPRWTSRGGFPQRGRGRSFGQKRNFRGGQDRFRGRRNFKRRRR